MAVTSLQEGNGTMIPTSVLLGVPAPNVSPTPLDEELRDMKRYLDKQRELEEFYSTYDVWTGIRTAITLALFFVFTVTLILYKSKCKPRRKYELYPSLEDMPGRPLDYYDYWCSSPGSHDAGKSGDTVDALGVCYNQGRGESGSAPLPTQRSVDSYSSLNNSFRVKSLPGSVMRINCSRNSSFERDDTSQAHSVRSEYLAVPGVRLQSTGSSSDGYSAGSSTHDLTGEMTPMALLGVPGLGPRGNKPLLQLGGMDWDSDHATAEWIQTIDINVIQPTPNISPCGSVRSVSDNSELARLPLPGRGRIASVLSLDSPEFDNRSIGSDSVFMEDSMGEMFSSRSESMDSPSPSLLASPRPSLTPSPHPGHHKIQSFCLGINPSTSLVAPSSPVPNRSLQSLNSLYPQGRRNRQKKLQRQQVQELPLCGLAPPVSTMTSLVVPTLSSHLRSLCEHLAAHSTIMTESERSTSRSPSLLAPNGSTEEEPMCAVFTVPSLRRCISAQEADQNGEPTGWKRSDSEQAAVVRRADSASGPQRQSSESSSGSDDASESVSFHLMVPALSIDNPSADTSRASSPSISPSSSSPNSSPPLGFRTPTPQALRVLEPPLSPSPTLSLNGRAHGRGLRSNGRINGHANGRRVLRRQYSQCIPPSPTLLEVPATHTSLPTYVEEDDPNIDYYFPGAPPPSPFRAGHALYMRRDSGPPSPQLAAYNLSRRDSSPILLHPDGYQLLRQDSSPSSSRSRTPQLQREDSSPTSPYHRTAYLQRENSSPSPHLRAYIQREDSSPTSPYRRSYLQRDDSSPSPSQFRTAYLQREDSSPSPYYSRTSNLQHEDSSSCSVSRQGSSQSVDQQDGSQTPSSASSVMETSC